MDKESTIQLAFSALEGCVNVIHAAFVHRKVVEDDKLQQLINDIRGLASVVCSTAPLWQLNLDTPTSPGIEAVLQWLPPLYRQLSATLKLLEKMLPLPIEHVLDGYGMGANVLNWEFIAWKVNNYEAAVRVVLGVMKSNYEWKEINLEKLKEQARRYESAMDGLDKRAETGDLLLQELVKIPYHLEVLERLQKAAKLYTVSVKDSGAEIAHCSVGIGKLMARNYYAADRSQADIITETPSQGTSGPQQESEGLRSARIEPACNAHVRQNEAMQQGTPDVGSASKQVPTTDSEKTRTQPSHERPRTLQQAHEDTFVDQRTLMKKRSLEIHHRWLEQEDQVYAAKREAIQQKLEESGSSPAKRNPNSSGLTASLYAPKDVVSEQPTQDAPVLSMGSSRETSTDYQQRDSLKAVDFAEKVVDPPKTQETQGSESPEKNEAIAISMAFERSQSSSRCTSSVEFETPIKADSEESLYRLSPSKQQSLVLRRTIEKKIANANASTAAPPSPLLPSPARSEQGVEDEEKEALSLMSEHEQVARVLRLLKEPNLSHAAKTLGRIISLRRLSLTSRLVLAEGFYKAACYDRVIPLLQVPLTVLQDAPLAAARIDHLLAKTHFSLGAFTPAINCCKVSMDRKKKQLGSKHPSFLESVELLAQLLRATENPSEAEALRRQHFTPEQCNFLRHIDDLEAAFNWRKQESRDPKYKLMLMSFVAPAKTSVLDQLGLCEEWGFHTTVLGFHSGTSLLSLLRSAGESDKLMLLFLRGNVTVGLPSGQTRQTLDTLLQRAVSANQAERVENLLDAGADIETESDAMTSLHSAAKSGYSDIVNLLVDRGANIDARTGDDQSALALAEANGHRKIVEYLAIKGAKK
ncbi:ankyrin repeat domain-containing protein [Aspergillus mulundensis]|uniref:Uncharacterized protein n=1 Tax=Aspergillus mulundensis TaxID=1810919 RepID=A0A3D8QIS9_9EURO|nr:hypothetical protein DSM5745_10398 [Aspergillus mulundensis]RDW61726.1 hypothetical protein DSM5745_10398 [Aspergillus mulundensis]